MLCASSPYFLEHTCRPDFYSKTIPILFASLPWHHEEKQLSMMESEKRKVADTDESADNEGPDYGEPSNIQSEDQHLRSLLTSLDKEQLVDILVVLGMKIPQVAEGIRGAARHTASHRKLIVHGFGEETTSETLGDAFSSYGEVEDAHVAVDRTTGKSRCFGFITFKGLESVKKALEKQKTWVDGRLAHQQPPFEAEIASVDDADPRKLFVTRISSDITTEMFLSFFEKYGEIEKGSIIYDKSTRTSRGFGYVTFKTVEAATAAITDPDKVLGTNRISVEIKRYKKKINKVQEESVTYAPQVHNSPYAIAPQHYGLQSQVPHPRFSGYEPYGIPLAYQPHFSGYEPYGIPPAYQPPIVAYQPHFIGYEPYGILPAYQPPTIAYQPHFIGYEPYGIPPAYQPPTVAYQPPTGAYHPPTGFMAYPYYFAYQ